MTEPDYAAYFPPDRQQAASLKPRQTWWPWNGHHVHIARAPRPDAHVRLLLIHGAGGHSGALWPFAALLADLDLDVAAVDLPLYGYTASPDPAAVRYQDWVQLLVDLVRAEHDDRPLILLGASIGGMLAYEAAARTDVVAAVVATCLLDPRDRRARARMTRYGRLGAIAGTFTTLVRGPLAREMIPMSWVADLRKMSRDRGLSELCADDPRGGGARVPLGLLASYLRFRHTPPELMSTPVTLVHPNHDAWTPIELSIHVLRRVAAPAHLVMLRQCGHFPVEEPGLTDLLDTIASLAREIADTSL